MAMATTVLRVHSLSRVLIALLMLTFWGCQHQESPDLPVLNLQYLEANTKQGVFYVNDTAFSGMDYGLFPGTTDTSFVKSYQEGREHGAWRQYYSAGQLREVRHFHHGKKEGEYQAWWPNGQHRLVYHFANGEYEGNCREWNVAGVLIKEMNYRQGYEEGAQKLWYNDGKIKSNYVMKNGRLYGLL